jgi:ribosomal protein S7
MTAQEHEGVAVDFITVDYISDVSGEVTHSLASANTAALKLSMEAIQNQGVNILGNGVLSNSNTEQTYMVRRDSLDTISSTTTVAAIQAAVRALDGLTPDKVTATISSATAADRDMGDTSVGA